MRIAWLVLGFALLAGSAWAGSRVALVRSLEGKVTVGGRPATPYLPVEEGSKLELGAGSRVTLDFLKSGRRDVVQGPGEVTVSEEGCRGTARVVSSESSRKSSLAAGHARTMGGVASRPAKVIFAETTFRANPVFRWTAEETGVRQVQVLAEKEGPPLWEAKTAKNELAYAGPPLELDRTYYLGVLVPSDYDFEERGTWTRFQILSEETAGYLEEVSGELERFGRSNQDPAPLLLLLDIYDDKACVQKALETGLEALTYADRLNPGEQAELHRTVARLYGERSKGELGVPHEHKARELEGTSQADRGQG